MCFGGDLSGGLPFFRSMLPLPTSSSIASVSSPAVRYRKAAAQGPDKKRQPATLANERYARRRRIARHSHRIQRFERMQPAGDHRTPHRAASNRRRGSQTVTYSRRHRSQFGSAPDRRPHIAPACDPHHRCRRSFPVTASAQHRPAEVGHAARPAVCRYRPPTRRANFANAGRLPPNRDSTSALRISSNCRRTAATSTAPNTPQTPLLPLDISPLVSPRSRLPRKAAFDRRAI